MARTANIKNDEIIAAIEGGELGATAVGHGTKTVTTAGTPVQLSVSSVPCKRVWIQAYETNTGVMAIGGASVSANASTRNGTWFFPTQGDWFEVSNLNLLYIDASVNGEKITYYYES